MRRDPGCGHPHELDTSVRHQPRPGPEAGAFPVENGAEPTRIGRRGALHAKMLHPGRDELEPQEPPAPGLQLWQVHEPELAPELLVAADAFVVVDEIAAAVEDEPVPVDFDRLRMMGVGVGYRMGRDMRIGFNVDRERRESPVQRRDYLGYRTGISVTYGR